MNDLAMATELFWDQVANYRPRQHGRMRQVLKELIDWTNRHPELRFVWEERAGDGKRVVKFCLDGMSVSFWAAWPREGDGARLTLLASGHPTYPEDPREFARQELARILGRPIGPTPQVSLRALIDPVRRKLVKRLLTQLFCRLTGRTINRPDPPPTPPVRIPDRTEFRTELKSRLDRATGRGWDFIEIDAAILHFAVSRPVCPSSLAVCCEVMRAAMLPGDRCQESPMRWVGGPVPAVRYLLPRRPPVPSSPQGIALPEPTPPPTFGYQPSGEDNRTRVPRDVAVRPGQDAFREALVERYGRRCLVTGCGVLAALEAAHISPWRGENDNDPANGLLLRADIHTLFDQDLLGIAPEHLRVELHPSIAGDYGELAGRTLDVPADHRPSDVALKQRFQRFREHLTASS